MNRATASAAAAALAMGSLMAVAPSASAETITSSGCVSTDFQVTNGTTVVLTYGDDCELTEPFRQWNGSPTIVHQAKVDGYALLWHQAVGRPSADATCDEGWSPSWAEWMNDKQGGYTCERVIDWGVFAGNPESVWITINDSLDVAATDVNRAWVFGCDWYFLDWRYTGNCPTDT